MPATVIRPFQRSDREQVTRLVNAHVEAVLPGVSVSVNAVMSQLEREPGEAIVDPWVSERATLVAIERERVVAAAHLFATRPRSASARATATSARSAGSFRPGQRGGGAMSCWRPARRSSPPGRSRAPPPTCRCRARAATACPTAGRTCASCSSAAASATRARPRSSSSPTSPTSRPACPRRSTGLALRRELGGPAVAGPRLGARLGDELIGFLDLSADLTSGGTLSRLAGWGEIDSLWVAEDVPPPGRRDVADRPGRRRGSGWDTPTGSSPTAPNRRPRCSCSPPRGLARARPAPSAAGTCRDVLPPARR